MKKVYRVTDATATSVGYNGYQVDYIYGGQHYSVTGEFYIDPEGYLHHEHISKTGKEIPFKIKVR